MNEIAQWAAEHEQARRDLDREVASLTARQRRAWFRVYARAEAFDGEWEIALSVLRRRRAEGALR